MKVSIIMPCYNVEETLIRALDSIAMQAVNFEYEVLVVDDASEDHTVEIAQQYALTHPQVKVICNEENRGNAYTYYVGLCASQGDYFCVLDGDDYYTIPDKLQRQVDFLDSDTDAEYVGTATHYIIDLGDNMVCVPDRFTHREFTYTDLLTKHSGYYHTATYMYRNIFRGNVPFSFGDVLYRGDTPRTMFHLMYSGKKIKVLDFVGSAYAFNFRGIWSSAKQKEQCQYMINYHTKHKENVTTELERQAADRQIQLFEKQLQSAKDDFRKYPAMTIDQAIKRVGAYAGRFAFGQKDFVLKHAYYSSYIDTLCASLGYVDRVHHPKHIQLKANTNHIGIIIGVLNPGGGGIFTEINELIEMFKDKHVYLFVTNMKSVPEQAQSILERHHNLTIVCPPEDVEQRLAWFQKKLVEIAPYRCYYYCSHNDTYGATLVQPGTPENITLFSFDHGYLCGISNPYLDTIAAKRPVDYWMLKKKFKEKVILLHAWSNGAEDLEGYVYQPFHEHDKIITASGAARYYKLDGKPPYRYIDLIIELLKKGGGVHYHFGVLPEEVLNEIQEKLLQAGVDQNCFVHIPWAENIPLELLKRNVDVLIEPFPVVSYKLTLQVLSVGIPVIARVGLLRMEIADFLPKESFFWRTKDEFIKLLLQADKEILLEKSKQCINYFNEYHSYDKVKKLLYDNKGMDITEPIIYPDDTLSDITESLRMFGYDFEISIYEGPDASKRKKELMKKEKQAKKKIKKIRASKSYKLGFVITFPFRFCKQLCVNVFKYGPFKGIEKTKKAMNYRRKNPVNELRALQNSLAYRVGKLLGKPYRYIRFGGKKRQMRQLLEEINKQAELLSQLKEEISAGGELRKKLDSLDERFVKRENNVETKLRAIRSSIEEQKKMLGGLDKRISRRVSNIIEKTLPKKTIEHLDYHLTEHCNLNCAGCSVFSPLADKKFADLHSFEQDLKRLHDLIGDSVHQIHLLGGEPLLHPQAGEFAKVSRAIFKYARIDFTTNGLLIYDMSDSFWDVLRDNDIAIKYTHYPINFDYSKMAEYVKSKGIFVFTAGGENAIQYFRRIPLNAKRIFNMYNSFINCPYRDCTQLRDGKLFICGASGFADLLNKRVREESEDASILRISEYDYVDLYQAKSKTEVFEYLSNAIPFCRYCDMDHIEEIEWKTSKRDIREWMDL